MSTANTYKLSGKKIAASGQQRQVYDAMLEINAPCTVREVSTQLEKNPNFKTRQTTERIAAYYVCVMKKSGVVEVVNETVVNDETEVYFNTEK